jgi:hypothetical protein
VTTTGDDSVEHIVKLGPIVNIKDLETVEVNGVAIVIDSAS